MVQKELRKSGKNLCNNVFHFGINWENNSLVEFHGVVWPVELGMKENIVVKSDIVFKNRYCVAWICSNISVSKSTMLI